MIMENNKVGNVHSKKIMISYNFGSLSREFIAMAFNILVFFYYEVEIGLNVWLIALGLVLFAIYNAINDKKYFIFKLHLMYSSGVRNKVTGRCESERTTCQNYE